MPRVAKEFEDEHIASAVPVMLSMIQRGAKKSVASLCKSICDEISDWKPLALERNWRRWSSTEPATRTLPTFLSLVPIVRVARAKEWLDADVRPDVRALIELVEARDCASRERWRRKSRPQLRNAVANALGSNYRITGQVHVATEDTLKVIGDALAESVFLLCDPDAVGYGRALEESIDSGLAQIRQALHDLVAPIVEDDSHFSMLMRTNPGALFGDDETDPSKKLGENFRKL